VRTATRLAAILGTATLLLAGCGGGGGGTAGEPSPGAPAATAGGGGQALKVGLAYDIGGRGDQSFNDAAAAGLDRAKSELGVEIREVEATGGEPDSAKEERLRQLAEGGFNPVIAVGFAYANPLKKVAAEIGETQFAIVDDASFQAPNVASLVFAEHEGSYVVGAAAALKSKKNSVGFVGGVQVPLIKKFEAGYRAGVEAAKPGTKVAVKYLSQPPDFKGFRDPAGGKTAAEGMFDAGADVVYHAAGGSGAGVFEAAKAAGGYAIGVDSDQYKTAPASVRDVILTSMLKKVDVAVYDFIQSVQRGAFESGVTTYDLEAGGVDYSTSGGKIEDIQPQLEKLKQQVIDGTVTVPSS
jgi:basic membrane protein A